MSSDKLYVCPGDLRSGMLGLFDVEQHEINVLLSAPGHVRGGFDGLSDVLADRGNVSRRTAFAYRQAVLAQFAAEIDTLPQTEEWEEVLHAWLEQLMARRAQVKHRPDVPLFTRLVSYPQRTLVTSGPVTRGRTEANHDLELELLGEPHVAARRWFKQHYDRGEDISDEVMTTIKESWAGPFVEPMDLYYKVLTQYFAHTIEGLDTETDANSMLEHLTEFQRDAYEHAKGILRRFGGVFLSDVVGLGKTYIGLAVLKHLQQRYGEHAVIVAPPKVCPQWEQLAAEFRVELVTVSHGNLTELAKYSDREILVIDESHNFRNSNTLRHDLVTKWLRPDDSASTTKVILLSATPQNNDALDVKHQLEFFPDTYSRLPYRGESLDSWFREVKQGASSLSDLLQHVVVRRTRTFIKRHYPDATILRRESDGSYERVPLAFPQRVSGEEQTLRYSIEKTYGEELYARILATLSSMHYAIYNLSDYVLPAYQSLPELQNLRRTGKSLRGLFKVLLLKRLESSIHAFGNTAARLSAKLRGALGLLDQGLVRIRAAEAVDAEDDELDIESLSEVPVRWFDVQRLRAHIEEDANSMEMLTGGIGQLRAEEDAKLVELRRFLSARPPNEHRTIVFTQFADTAHYLGRGLGDAHGRTSVVTGSTTNGLSIARRFAPKANRIETNVADGIDLLISTDALSEGVNLQDADTLINYDIHWNPVRLIQRAGRIDRIGSENEEIHIASFLPERGLEAELGLESVLRRRITEFLDVFGEDSAILPSDEQLDENAVFSAYSGDAFARAEADSDMDGLSRHAERLLALRREDPDRYNRVVLLRTGRRAVTTNPEPSVVAARTGWHWAFFVPSSCGTNVERLGDDQDGLDLIFRHATSGEGRAAEHLELRSLRKLVRASLDVFQDEANLLAQQRRRPKLSPTEDFLVSSIEDFRKGCLVTEQPLVDRVMDWVRAGAAQAQLRRTCRHWKKDRLAPSTVFTELRVLYERRPPVEEVLGPPMVIAAFQGRGSSTELKTGRPAVETANEIPVVSQAQNTSTTRLRTVSAAGNSSDFVKGNQPEELRQGAPLPRSRMNGDVHRSAVPFQRNPPEPRVQETAAIQTGAMLRAPIRFLSPFPDERNDLDHPGYTEQELRALCEVVTPQPPLQSDPASRSEELKTFLIGIHSGVIDLETAGRRMNQYCAVEASEKELSWSRARILSHFAAYGFDIHDNTVVFRDRQNGLRRIGYESVDEYISWPTNRLSMR